MSERKNIRGLGTLYKRADDGPWYVDFSVKGRQHRESTRTASYNEAVKYLKGRIAEVQSGKFGGLAVERITVAELLDDVLENYRLYHPKSYDAFVCPIVEQHLRPYFGRMRAASVTTASIRAFISECVKAGAKPASVNRRIGVLRRAFALGQQTTPVKVVNPPTFKGLMFEEDNARMSFFEHDEYERFRDALPEDERAVFVFGYYTLVRWSEALGLTWDRVDFDQRVAWLTDTKNGDDRPVSIADDELFALLSARKALRDTLCPSTPWVFFRSVNRGDRGKSTRQVGKPVRDIRRYWEAAATATGINKHYHDLRRTGARNMRRAGVSEGVIMAVGGWRTRAVFERYNIKDTTDRHEAAKALAQMLKGKGNEPEKR